jgi:hypothetical protein
MLQLKHLGLGVMLLQQAPLLLPTHTLIQREVMIAGDDDLVLVRKASQPFVEGFDFPQRASNCPTSTSLSLCSVDVPKFIRCEVRVAGDDDDFPVKSPACTRTSPGGTSRSLWRLCVSDIATKRTHLPSPSSKVIFGIIGSPCPPPTLAVVIMDAGWSPCRFQTALGSVAGMAASFDLSAPIKEKVPTAKQPFQFRCARATSWSVN